jgi:hypothetical protein
MIAALPRPRSRARIPLADVAELRRQIVRTRAVRLALGAAIALVSALALQQALALRPAESQVLPPSGRGIVVMDVSSSITADTYRQIIATIDELTASGRRFGLVLFSDSAYEAFPPGTRATEMAAMRRFFRPLLPGEARDQTGRLRIGELMFPANPWSVSYSGGTQISSGLLLARAVMERDDLDDASILLVSDLSTDQFDVATLGSTLAGLIEDKVPLRVVALSPSPTDKLFFQELLRGHAAVVDAPKAAKEELSRPPKRREPAFPIGLVAAAAALFALLTANELWNGRLRWRAS